MRKSLLILLCLWCMGVAQAQNQSQTHCNRPISNIEFSRNKQNISSQGSESQKMQRANDFLEQNCLTVAQFKEILSLFNDDLNRLRLAQNSTKSIFDPENIFEVFDSFQKLSTAFLWYDILKNSNTRPQSNPNDVPKPNNNDISFPDLDYPFAGSYTGKKGCATALSEDAFLSIARRIKASSTADNIRYNALLQLNGNNCFTTSQAMRFATLISTESLRLDYLKITFNKNILDQDNFQYASQTLQNVKNQEMLLEHIQLANGGLQDTNGTSCVGVSEQEYTQMTSTINAERINSTKMELTKSIVQNYKCFSIEQVRGLMKLFMLESQKLEIAKMMYQYTAQNQKKQYYVLTNDLRMSSSKSELMEHIKKS